MDNFKFLKTVIIALLIINTGILAYLWLGNAHRPPPPHPMSRGNAFDFLTHELKLSLEQEKQLEILRSENRQMMENLRKDEMTLHDDFFKLLGEQLTDSAKVNAIADQMAASRKKIELQTFYHFKQLRSICTEEQQKKFDVIIGDALRQMAPGPPGR